MLLIDLLLGILGLRIGVDTSDLTVANPSIKSSRVHDVALLGFHRLPVNTMFPAHL